MRSSTAASRIIARKTGAQVKLYSHPGNELTRRFPLIVDALSPLRSRSSLIDGAAVACDDHGVAYGAFGGSLCASSSHSLSATLRISSDMVDVLDLPACTCAAVAGLRAS